MEMGEPQVIKTQNVNAYLVQPTDDGIQIAVVLKVAIRSRAFASVGKTSSDLRPR